MWGGGGGYHVMMVGRTGLTIFGNSLLARSGLKWYTSALLSSPCPEPALVSSGNACVSTPHRE